jgi:hypothetical protein
MQMLQTSQEGNQQYTTLGVPVIPGGDGCDEDKFGPVRGLLKHTVRIWQLHWNAGTHLTVDESMISWEGATEGHLSYIPRKPHPCGFQAKTLCDARAGLFLNIDLVEGKDIDAQKRWS